MTLGPSRDPVPLFLGLTVVISSLAQAVSILSGGGLATIAVVMWSVGLAALVALRWSGGALASLGWRLGSARAHLLALALPAAYGLLGHGTAALLGLADFPAAAGWEALLGAAPLPALASPPLRLLLAGLGGLAVSMALALGEEIGWRGLLAPRLTRRLGFARAALVAGLVWAVWHMPMILFGGYDAGGAPGPERLAFVVMAVALSGPMAWLRLTTGSLWPAVSLHAAHNLLILGVFDRLAVRGSGALTLVGEFGLISAAATALVSLPFWIAGARRFRAAG